MINIYTLQTTIAVLQAVLYLLKALHFLKKIFCGELVNLFI